MKLIFFVTLGLFLCNFSVDSSSNDVTNEFGENSVREMADYAKQPFRKQVQGNSVLSSIARFFGRSDGDLKLTDLNMDCLLLIVEHLDFTDLLNVAQINDQFSIIAADVFRRKYSHLQIMVSPNFPIPSEGNKFWTVAGVKIDTNKIGRVLKRLGSVFEEIPTIKVWNTEIILENYGQIVNTFKYFGYVIKKFKSDGESFIRPLQIELIGNLISKHSSKSLIDVEFVHLNIGELLGHITRPLINVASVTLKERHIRFSETLRLDELFPAVRRLNLDFSISSNLTFHHMPNLEHVSIQGTPLFAQSPCMDLIINNPQIRSIYLYNDDPVYLKKMSIILPQLETLALSNFELENGRIEFANVSTLVINHGWHTSPKNLHFPRLHTLHIDYRRKYFGEWLDFVNEHRHLRNFSLKHYGMDDIQFQQLTANLTDLVEITLDHHITLKNHLTDRLSAIVIGEFLRSHDNVMQVNLIRFSKYRELALRTLLKREWDSKVIGDRLSFKRKINTQF